MRKVLALPILILIAAMLFVSCSSNPEQSARGGSSSTVPVNPGDPGDSGESGGSDETPQQKWTVTFELDGGTALEGACKEQEITDGNKAAKPEPDPAKEGKAFGGWKNGDKAYTFDEPVTSDITLTAVWKEIPTAQEFIGCYRVYLETSNINRVLSSQFGNGEITYSRIEEKKYLMMDALTAALTADTESRRYHVTYIHPSSSGNIVSADEAADINLSFSYIKQVPTVNENGEEDWVDDPADTEVYDAYLVYSYKAETGTNKETVSDLTSNIQLSSSTSLPDISDSTPISYKPIALYYDESGNMTGCALDGINLTDGEFTKVRNAIEASGI